MAKKFTVTFSGKKGRRSMAISKKIRFEVFKRDGFTCAYCGKTPPSVILEVDHIDPKANGGEDDINNLITACFDCNRGKRDIPLTKIPSKLSDNLEVLREQEEQLKEYRKFIDEIQRRLKKDARRIEKIFMASFPGWRFSDQFLNSSLIPFLKKLPFHEVEEALYIAIGKFRWSDSRAIKYFCGICWRKIKGIPDGGRY
jgi:hypothetical protein